MLQIKPIQTKEQQAEACARCGIPYDSDCMAYAATLDGAFIGMAQFTIEKGHGHLKNLLTVDNIDDFEALFIMGRAVLNFIDLCGVHTATCETNAAPPRLLTAIGFKPSENGMLTADMTHMFNGCGEKHE